MVPLTETHTMADLAKRLGLTALVVARGSLGTWMLTFDGVERFGAEDAQLVGQGTRPSD